MVWGVSMQRASVSAVFRFVVLNGREVKREIHRIRPRAVGVEFSQNMESCIYREAVRMLSVCRHGIACIFCEERVLCLRRFQEVSEDPWRQQARRRLWSKEHLGHEERQRSCRRLDSHDLCLICRSKNWKRQGTWRVRLLRTGLQRPCLRRCTW